jgi:hypothetical protein
MLYLGFHRIARSINRRVYNANMMWNVRANSTQQWVESHKVKEVVGIPQQLWKNNITILLSGISCERVKSDLNGSRHKIADSQQTQW